MKGLGVNAGKGKDEGHEMSGEQGSSSGFRVFAKRELVVVLIPSGFIRQKKFSCKLYFQNMYNSLFAS